MKLDLSKILNIISLITIIGGGLTWYTNDRIQKGKREFEDQQVREIIILLQDFTDEQIIKNTEFDERYRALRDRVDRLEDQ